MESELQIVETTSPAPTARHRRLTNGWVRSENLEYEAEVAASPEPWFVPKIVWTQLWDARYDRPQLVGTLQIRKCRDDRPGIGRWVYRGYTREKWSESMPTDDEWVPTRYEPFGWTLAQAKGER